MKDSNEVNELGQLWELENLYDLYLKEKGFKASFISHWDPITDYRKKIASKVAFPNQLPFIRYNYSKRITNKQVLLETVNIEKDMGVTLSPNGTISLNLVFNFLKSQNINKIVSLSPSYYIINNLAKINNISITNISWKRSTEEENYTIQKNGTTIDENTLVYITNPIYSSGYYLDNHLNELLSIIKNNPWVVLDESLSLRNRSIMKCFINNPKVISIYSPHKTICINAYKFSFIIYNNKYSSYFEQWTDVIYGGLSRENVSAMEHYLSSNFAEVEDYIIKETFKNKTILMNKIEDCNIHFDKNTSGHFISLHYPKLNAGIGNNIKELKKMVFSSGLSFIPNIRNNMNSNYEFSYRINLLRVNEKSIGRILRLHSYLNSII